MAERFHAFAFICRMVNTTERRKAEEEESLASAANAFQILSHGLHGVDHFLGLLVVRGELGLHVLRRGPIETLALIHQTPSTQHKPCQTHHNVTHNTSYLISYHIISTHRGEGVDSHFQHQPASCSETSSSR
eukprot:scaffold727_cov173-Ochromonas_danica.AAC.7